MRRQNSVCWYYVDCVPIGFRVGDWPIVHAIFVYVVFCPYWRESVKYGSRILCIDIRRNDVVVTIDADYCDESFVVLLRHLYLSPLVVR